MRLVRAAGWSLEYIDAMSVSRAFDMASSLNLHPSADEILAAVYLKKQEKAKPKPQTRDDALAQMTAFSGSVGGMQASMKLPPHLRAMAEQALKVQAKLGKYSVN